MSSCKEILSFSKARQNTFSKFFLSQHNKKTSKTRDIHCKSNKGKYLNSNIIITITLEGMCSTYTFSNVFVLVSNI